MYVHQPNCELLHRVTWLSAPASRWIALRLTKVPCLGHVHKQLRALACSPPPSVVDVPEDAEDLEGADDRELADVRKHG